MVLRLASVDNYILQFAKLLWESQEYCVTSKMPSLRRR
jgi:hypothetical protein